MDEDTTIYLGVEIDPLEVMPLETMRPLTTIAGERDLFETKQCHATFPIYLRTRVECDLDEMNQRRTVVAQTWWLVAGQIQLRDGAGIDLERMTHFSLVADALLRKKSSKIVAFHVSAMISTEDDIP